MASTALFTGQGDITPALRRLVGIANLFNAFRSADWLAYIDSTYACVTMKNTTNNWQIDVYSPGDTHVWSIQTTGLLNEDLPYGMEFASLPEDAENSDIVAAVIKIIVWILAL